MKLAKFKVKHYRSFADEQEITLANTNVLIGPNNAGKSNFLRAIELFFLTFESDQGFQYYKHSRDFPRMLTTGRTSLTAVFQLEDGDKDDNEILKEYETHRRKMKLATTKNRDVQINLQFSEKGTPYYSLFPGSPIPHIWRMSEDFHSQQQDLIGKILRRFNVVYIPAEKELRNIYTRIIVEVVKDEISDQIEDFLDEIGHQADLVSNEINGILASVGMPRVNIFFEPPPSFSELVTGFDMTVIDRSIGSLFEKSMGMQWLIIACCISWVSRSIKRRAGLRCLWLVEEPESYLHPELFPKQRSAFEKIGSSADIVYTTHSLGFVSEDVSRVNGIFFEDKQSTVTNFKTHEEAINRIKKGLGIRFSDYFRFHENTVAVEGQWDIDYLKWFLGLVEKKVESPTSRWPILFNSEFTQFGGVVGLSGFIRANYQFIREEIAFIPIFDGDEAGKRATKDLRNYLNGRTDQIPFHANSDYLLLPGGMPIEGLFPNYYLRQFKEEHPSWFKDFEVDTEGQIVSFSLLDDRKATFAKTVMYRAENDVFTNWSDRWLNMLDALEKCLQIQSRRLTKKDSLAIDQTLADVEKATG